MRGARAQVLDEDKSGLHPRFTEAAHKIERIFGRRSKKVTPKDVRRLRGDLEKLLGPREQWDSLLLRELFGALWEGMGRRRRSDDHERIWFNLSGYCLRPGFGYPLDDWRVEQLWSLYEQGVQFATKQRNWAEWWILWRRAAGGLDESAQCHLLDDIAFYLQPPGRALVKRPPGPKRQGYDDMVRLAASLERVPVARKTELGCWLLERLAKPKENSQSWWAVARLASREPINGSVHNVVPSRVAEDWLERILALDWKRIESAPFAAAMLARKTGDRSRDLDQQLRERVARRLAAAKAPATWVRMVREVTALDAADARRVLGDSLPQGLRLVR